MEYTENTVICNCKHVTLADIDNALQRSAHFSDVEKEFAEVQKLNLDAIHDTVHEMAKDEARHGRALKGLLERYFK